jgi:aminoglycoside phosphotransferase (APT) family kinase protein
MTGPVPLTEVERVPHGRTAQRLTWPHLPRHVRDLVERRLGSSVVEAQSQGAGFTPGFASRLTGENGETLFVKAASRHAQAQIAASYAEEGRKLTLLPSALPMPRPRWSHQDEDWVVLAFESVQARNPGRPWRRADLDACLRTLEEVADILRVVPEGLALKPLYEDLPTLRTGWDDVRSTSSHWPHLDEAAELASRYPELPEARHFIHADVRDDNLMLTRDGKALLCDWNWPALGPVWQDTVDLLICAFGDGHDADELLTRSDLTRDVDPDHIDTWLAAFTGFMLSARERPFTPTSPFLRVHARWYSEVAWAWLAQRRGWR